MSRAVQGVINKTSARAILKRIEAEKKIVAAARDRLRELEEELAELGAAWTDALDNLQYSVDRISELV